MHAVALEFDLHVPVARSLKAKRQAVRPVIDGLRHRFHCSVAEVDHHDRWQRAAIGVALIAESHHHLDEIIASVDRFVYSAAGVEVIDRVRYELVDEPIRDDRSNAWEVGPWDAAQ